MRRQQRALSKYQLRRAIKDGKSRRLPGQRFEYRHNGLVVIVDGRTKTEITSYKEVEEIPYKTIDSLQRSEHDRAREMNQLQVSASAIISY